MTRKRAAIILVALILAVAAVIAIKNPPVRALFIRPQEPSATPGTLDWYAQQAQEVGATTYEFQASNVEYVHPSTLDEVLSEFSFVIAQPIEIRSYASDNSDIESWIKFRVIETLSLKTVPQCPTCPTEPTPPNDMLPLQANEILASKVGGILTHNGIELIASNERFPDLLQSERYLLILDKYPSGVCNLLMGAEGVYKIDGNGMMTPLQPKIDPYHNDLLSRYGNSVNQLKTALGGTPTAGACDPDQEQNCYNRGGDWNPSNCSCQSNPCIRKPWLCDEEP